MIAYAFLAVLAAIERSVNPTPDGLIALTCNEIHHLFNVLIMKPISSLPAPTALVNLATTTPTPREDKSLPATSGSKL